MSGKVNDLNKDISNNVDLEESYDSKKANKYMKEAIKQAKKAASIGEVPIGCVIVYQDNIIGRGYNRRMVDKNTLSHAELNAIKKASKKLDDWRLDDWWLLAWRNQWSHAFPMPHQLLQRNELLPHLLLLFYQRLSDERNGGNRTNVVGNL